jgi:hypothetical protein
LHIDYRYNYGKDDNGKIHRWSINSNDSRFPMDISGYDFMVYAEEDNGFLVITDGDKVQEKIDVSGVKAELLQKIDLHQMNNTLSKEDLTFALTGDRFDVKLIVGNREINNPDAEEVKYADYLDGFVLVKRNLK